jgi:hypothetical protein
MKKNHVSRVLICLGLSVLSLQGAEGLPEFIDQSFDAFLKRCVTTSERESFALFYRTFVQKKMSYKKMISRGEVADFEQLGKNSLEVKNPLWAQKLNAYQRHQKLSARQAHKNNDPRVKRFLVRYGAYQQFLKEKQQEATTLWAMVRSYTGVIKNKCSYWITALRGSQSSKAAA